MANQTMYLLERLRIKKQVGIEINSNLHVLSAFMDIHIVFPNSDHSCPQQIWKTSDSWQPQVTKETIFCETGWQGVASGRWLKMVIYGAAPIAS